MSAGPLGCAEAVRLRSVSSKHWWLEHEQLSAWIERIMVKGRGSSDRSANEYDALDLRRGFAEDFGALHLCPTGDRIDCWI